MPQSAAWNMGFLTVLHETKGYLGGLLITNFWGRPLEFRVSTAVQPNRVQQILYGDTLLPYVCSDLIGKTLLDKSSTAVNLLITNTDAALDVRLSVDFPVLLRTGKEQELATTEAKRRGRSIDEDLFCHVQFPQDADAVSEMLSGRNVDLDEPFLRIREAVTEARKMGVTSRG